MEAFQHEPLDHTQTSLRLLSVLPELSPNGLVQCVLYHGIIDEVQGAILPSHGRVDYTCLSYVWGTPESSSQYCLVINGKKVEVLRNLHGFLHIAHQQYIGEFLWIDALCIDQDNLEERNHQVSEMGSIYSRAKQVIAWLGACEVNLNALRMLQIKTQNPLPGLTPYQDDYMISEFFNAVDSYWSRAWITQEVALARRVLLLFGTAELDISMLDKRQVSVVVNQLDRWTRRDKNYSSSSLLRIWTLAKSQQSRVKKPEDCVANVSLDSDSISLQTGSDDACLLTLLSQFRNKECRETGFTVYDRCVKRGHGSKSIIVCHRSTFCITSSAYHNDHYVSVLQWL